jgi:hypothetical protein
MVASNWWCDSASRHRCGIGGGIAASPGPPSRDRGEADAPRLTGEPGLLLPPLPPPAAVAEPEIVLLPLSLVDAYGVGVARGVVAVLADSGAGEDTAMPAEKEDSDARCTSWGRGRPVTGGCTAALLPLLVLVLAAAGRHARSCESDLRRCSTGRPAALTLGCLLACCVAAAAAVARLPAADAAAAAAAAEPRRAGPRLDGSCVCPS